MKTEPKKQAEVLGVWGRLEDSIEEAINGKECVVWISKRPPYCDRGNYLAHVEPKAGTNLAMDLDLSDGWPRYYMDLERAKAEIVDWMKKRKQL